jgi:hypothetical protein
MAGAVQKAKYLILQTNLPVQASIQSADPAR